LELENDEDMYDTFKGCIKARHFSKSCDNIRWADLHQSIRNNEIEMSPEDLATTQYNEEISTHTHQLREHIVAEVKP
jgi:hypothetical protein